MRIDASNLTPKQRRLVENAIHTLLDSPDTVGLSPQQVDDMREASVEYELHHGHRAQFVNAGEGVTTSWQAFQRDRRAKEEATANAEARAAVARRSEEKVQTDSAVHDLKADGLESALRGYGSVPESAGQAGASGGAGSGRY
jgi:hypothetical protein